jgi:hypothetical protein
MALATTQDFELRHGPLLDVEANRVEALLADATGMIELELAGFDLDWLDPDGDAEPPAAVKAVCIQAAYRAWANPDSVAREELGEAARTYRGTDQADALWLTKNEARLVRKAAGAGSASLTSIQVETPYSGDPAEPHPMDFWPFTEGS